MNDTKITHAGLRFPEYIFDREGRTGLPTLAVALEIADDVAAPVGRPLLLDRAFQLVDRAALVEKIRYDGGSAVLTNGVAEALCLGSAERVVRVASAAYAFAALRRGTTPDADWVVLAEPAAIVVVLGVRIAQVRDDLRATLATR